MDIETVNRTDEEIVARLAAMRESGTDLFGAHTSDLIMALRWPAAEPYLSDAGKEDGESGWVESRQANPAKEARDYMEFALGKAADHRGLSAGRSIDHFRAFVWLMGDDAYASIDWDDYPQYGAPILKAVCELIGYPWPADEALERMAQGQPCDPDGCYEGCG